MSIELIVLIVIVTALVFDFTNGFHDAANAMATCVATGAFKPKVAVLLAAIMNLVGAFLSTEVAKTIASGIVDTSFNIGPETVFAALVGAILWNLLTWLFGLPSSSSHAIFGALIGAVIVQAGMSGVLWSGVISKILLPALVAPVVAGVASWAGTKIAYKGQHNDNKDSKKRFRNGQRVSSLLVALSHGTSDGQKTMGIITLVLVVSTSQFIASNPGAELPWWNQAAGTPPHWWVIIAAGVAIALGTYSGGWRIMRTMGKGMAEIEPPQGFVSETAAMSCILASSHLGFGLSTTHVVSGSIMGTGLARTPEEVRWNTAKRMLIAWGLTLPAAGIVGGAAAWLAHYGRWGFVAVLAILLLGSVAIKIAASRNHVSHENVNDSHEVAVLAKAAISSVTTTIPNPLAPALPDYIADHPLAASPLRLAGLKPKPKPKKPKKKKSPPKSSHKHQERKAAQVKASVDKAKAKESNGSGS